MSFSLEGFGVLVGDAVLLLTQSESTLLTAVAPELLHIAIGHTLTISVPAKVTFSWKKWVAAVPDFVQDLMPWDQAVVDTQLRPQPSLNFVPLTNMRDTTTCSACCGVLLHIPCGPCDAARHPGDIASGVLSSE